MRPCHEAKKLSALLLASLAEVAPAADICCESQPIRVSPRTFQQVQSIVRVCAFHRVAWALEGKSGATENTASREVDVVLSLALLLCG